MAEGFGAAAVAAYVGGADLVVRAGLLSAQIHDVGHEN